MASSQCCSSCSKTGWERNSQSATDGGWRGGGIIPHCKCGDYVVSKVARTPQNASRQFWGCRHYKDGSSREMYCNFFKWCNEENNDERDGEIVRQRRGICELEILVQKLQKRIKLLLGVMCVVIALNTVTMWVCLG